MTTYNLAEKRFLIAGASSGIGREAAVRLAAEGSDLYLLGRNREQLHATCQQCLDINPIGDFKICQLDLIEEIKVREFVDEIGSLDGVVFAAGMIEPFPTTFLNGQKLDSMFHTNFYSAVNLIGALLKSKRIKPESSLVFVSSISSAFPHIGGALYSASKAALEAYMRNLAIEHTTKKIRANAICAGMVKTPLFDKALENISEEGMDNHLKKYPLGVGYPSDVANLILFLLSDQSRWITGNSIILDGGLHLGF